MKKTHEYPLIIVTNASNMAALNYEAFFKRIASWGFIVVGNDDRLKQVYQLQSDDEAAKAFVVNDAEILNNANWQYIEKNN